MFDYDEEESGYGSERKEERMHRMALGSMYGAFTVGNYMEGVGLLL